MAVAHWPPPSLSLFPQALLKKPAVVQLTRKNEVRPFEDAASLEFLASKNEAGAVLFVSHNKKRPHNMVLARMYDGHLLDMLELGVAAYTPMREHKGPKKTLGSPPCMVFAGDGWTVDSLLIKLRNMLLGAACRCGAPALPGQPTRSIRLPAQTFSRRVT